MKSLIAHLAGTVPYPLVLSLSKDACATGTAHGSTASVLRHSPFEGLRVSGESQITTAD
jgi:hypothetical protein